MGKREKEFARRIAYWRGAAEGVAARHAAGSRLQSWLAAVELWAYRAHWRDPIDAAPPGMEGDALGALPVDAWHDASTPPERPGRYLVVVAEAAKDGLPATRRLELIEWGPYAFAAPQGFDVSQLREGERHCSRDGAIHGHGWFAYDRTTDACTVWHPARTDERVTRWTDAPPLPAALQTTEATEVSP